MSKAAFHSTLAGLALALCSVALVAPAARSDAPAAADPAAAFARARTLEAAGETAAAIAVYRELIERYPQAPEPYNNLAVLLATEGRIDEARRTLLQGMQTSASYAAIHRNLNAITLEKARESYIKALRLGTTPRPPALAALDRLHVNAPAAETAAAPTTVATAAPEPLPVDPPAPGPAVRPPTDAPVPSSAPVAAPDLTRAVVDTAVVRRQAIEDMLGAWAAAWSARDPSLYLSFYSSAFVPATGGSRAQWAAQRRQRLTRPRWIEVKLDDLKVEVADEFHAVVSVRQQYRADNYRDTTLKRFTLKRESDGWRIAREQSLRTLH